MDARVERLTIAVDGDQLAGALLMPATLLPGVLFVHGWGDSKEQDLARAREMAGLGCVCLTFDLRGHAGADGRQETVTREENLRDLLAAYDRFVAENVVDPKAIAVVGISYGGYLATLLTELRPVRWLALRAPALYKDADWRMPKRALHKDPDFAAYRRREVPPNDNRALRACAKYTGDVLIVESERDDVVPHPATQSYVAAFAKAHSLTARVIDDADHALSDEKWRNDYTSILVGWLTEMIMGARAKVSPSQKEATPPPSSNEPEQE
jgi:uncharacterized protein